MGNKTEKGYYITTSLKDGKNSTYKTRTLTYKHTEMHEDCEFAETRQYDAVKKKWKKIATTGTKEIPTLVSK